MHRKTNYSRWPVGGHPPRRLYIMAQQYYIIIPVRSNLLDTLYTLSVLCAIKLYAASGNTIARVCVFLRLRRSSSARPNKYINEFICLRLPHSTRIYIAFTVLWFRRDRLSRTSPRVRKRRSFIGFVRPEKRYHYNALWFPYRCTSRSKCHSNKI